MHKQTLLAVPRDEDTAESIRKAASDRHVDAEVRTGDIDEAERVISERRILPDIVFIDVGDDEDPEASVSRLAESGPNDTETEVVVVGAHDSVDVYRRLRAMGVSDYLVKPVPDSEIGTVISEIFNAKLRVGNRIDAARHVCVHAVRGGAGGSTIATAVADMMARDHGADTLLVDLDLDGGTQYLALGEQETTGYVEMMENADRIDALLLDRTIERPRRNLAFLSSHSQTANVDFDPKSTEQLLLQAQRSFGHVVTDLPARPRVEKDVMLAADTLVLVTPATIPGLRETVHTLNYLEKNGFKKDPVVVLNRDGEQRSASVTIGDFNKRIDKRVRSIPYDPKAAARAMTTNTPINRSHGRTGKAVRAIAADLPTAPRKGDKRRRK